MKNSYEYGLNNKKKPKSIISKYITKILLSLILFLASIIFIKSNTKNLLLYKEYILTDSFSFNKANKIYLKYLSKVWPVNNKEKSAETKTVFKEQKFYTDITPYKNGFKLVINKPYNIPNITSGIVVFVGEKEPYGSSIIIQGVDGVDILYGNVSKKDIQLYDYVEKDTILGNTKNKTLYLEFSKEEAYLDYKEYLS